MEDARRHFRLQFTPQRLGSVLLVIVIGLAAAHSITTAIRYFFTPFRNLPVYQFFNLGVEANLPTYVSALNLLLCGILLSMITLFKRRTQDAFWKHWGGLAAGFLYMSVDEAAQFHEHLVGPLVQTIYVGEGVWSYVWYIAYIPLVAVLFIAYVPFLLHLSSRYMKGFVAAGALFIGGAIGMEMVEATLHAHEAGFGWLNLSVLFEESFEMLGVVLFIYMLSVYIQEQRINLHLQIGKPNSQNMHSATEKVG